MAVLVTGGAGYIGSHMVWNLVDREEPVVVLDDLSTGLKWLIPDHVPLFVGKVKNKDLLSAILKAYDIDSIVHFAAAIVVPESVSNPFYYYENNTGSSRILFEAAVEHGVKNIVFSSSAAVYGEPDAVPISENSKLAPLSPYGSSKLMTEIMLKDAAVAHGLNYVSLRYFNVAGACPLGRTGQSGPNATHIIKVAVQAALGVRNAVSIFGQDYPTPDGTCIRDYVHVSDLVDAHQRALTYLRTGASSLICNVGYGHGFSVSEVVEAVRDVSGRSFPIRFSPRRSGDPAKLVASNERIVSELGWSPHYDDLKTIVRHALLWEEKLLAKRAVTTQAKPRPSLKFLPQRQSAALAV